MYLTSISEMDKCKFDEVEFRNDYIESLRNIYKGICQELTEKHIKTNYDKPIWYITELNKKRKDLGIYD